MQKSERSMTIMGWLLLWGALSLMYGCGTPLIYPMKVDESEAVTVTEFGDLDMLPDTFKSRAVMMAGRIVGTKTQGQNVIITAEWLPVPKDRRNAPSEAEARPDRQFLVHYPSSIDSPGLWNGNKFLAVGRIHDAEAAAASVVPNLDASCLHIWKTRELSVTGVLDDERGRFPVPEQTYCQKS